MAKPRIGDILDAFYDRFRADGADYDDIEASYGHRGNGLTIEWDDPANRSKSQSPRTFRVIRADGGRFTFEEC